MSEYQSNVMETVFVDPIAIGIHAEGEQNDPAEVQKFLDKDHSPEDGVQDASSKASDTLNAVTSDRPEEDKHTDESAAGKNSEEQDGSTEGKDDDGAVSSDLKEEGKKELEEVDNLPGLDEADKAELQTNPNTTDETKTEVKDDTSIDNGIPNQSGSIAGNGSREDNNGERDEKALEDDKEDTNESTAQKSCDKTVNELHKKQKQSNDDAWSFSDKEDIVTAQQRIGDNVNDSGKKQQHKKYDVCAVSDSNEDNATASQSLEGSDNKSKKTEETVNEKTTVSKSSDDSGTSSKEKRQASQDIFTGYQPISDSAKSPFRTELRFRLVKTAALVTTWICIGLFTELTGPTFKDLEIRLNLPPDEATEAVSRATSGRSLGFFAGAVIGGFLVDRFKRKGDLFIGLALFCGAGVTIAVPWMSTLITMWFLMFCQGTFEGIINIAGQEIILLLWGEKSAGPMHLLHFGFGIGSFLNPLVAQPFLGIKVKHFANSTLDGYVLSPGYNSTNVTFIETIENSRIEYAYLIAAIITAAFSSTFFWYQFRGVPHGGYVEDVVVKEPVSTEKGCKQYLKIIDPASCADGRRLAGLTMFVLLFLYFFQAVGGERIYSKFIRNFALDQKFDNPFSSSEATYLNSSFWISFSIGRFLGFIIAIWVPIKILILIECFAALGFATLLNIFGRNNKLAVWILTQPMALFIAPLFPSGVAWSDHYLKMSGVGIMIIIAGGSLGGVVYIWVLGSFYPKYGPNTFLYFVLFYGIAAVVFSCLLSVAGYKYGDRFQKERMELEKDDGDDKPETITFTYDMKVDTL